MKFCKSGNAWNRGLSLFLMVSGLSVAAFSHPAWADPSPAPGAQTLAVETAPTPLTVDGRLRKNVDFWIRIYTQYTTEQGLIHDAKYIDHVYEVVDLGNIHGSQGRFLRNAKRKWRNLLLAVHQKQKTPEKMTEEEKRVFQLFQDVQEPNKFLNAAHRKRLRFQLGQKDRFLEGYKNAGRYLPVMEGIFRAQGLPVELTRLPFVESSFNLRARSKVGASGIWQFMRSTGRLFLTINDAVDERNDPIRATEAAAKLLKMNYDSLGKWPLAVTAYNHGRKGMMRAVRMVGSDEIEELVASYRGRTFGFASSNFFVELLAAIEVERNAEKYFGQVERLAPLQYYEVKIPDSVRLPDLQKFLKLERETLRSLNPGLADGVFTGGRRLPAGYALRLPLGKGENGERLEADTAIRVFMVGYNEIPASYKRPDQKYVRSLKKRKSQSPVNM